MKKFITQKAKTISTKSGYARLLAVCVAFSFGAFFAASSFAADKSAQIFEANKEVLQNVESYLNNIHNFSADFSQQSPEGVNSNGKFFLSRSKNASGKMRIQYSSDPKVIIVVNGATLSYYDVELDEVSQLSTNTTPASLLTRPNISFSAKDVELTGVLEKDETIRISLMKKNRKEAGEFSLIFKANPIEFSKMEVKDDLGQIVHITLSNIDFHSPIAANKFILK